jgi:hypothetical protein
MNFARTEHIVRGTHQPLFLSLLDSQNKLKMNRRRFMSDWAKGNIILYEFCDTQQR